VRLGPGLATVVALAVAVVPAGAADLGSLAATALTAPGPVVSFAGLGSEGAVPPDSNIAVSATQVVQMTNDGYAVFDKRGNRLAAGDATAPWQASGSVCADRDDGDPIVQYDRIAARWVLSRMVAPIPPDPSVGYWECVAVSAGDDATGAWRGFGWRLARRTLHDYPKLGVWGDSYYLTTIRFRNARTFDGFSVIAFDRSSMLAPDGAPKPPVVRDATPFTADPLLPATVADGAGTPPAADEYLVGSRDDRNELTVLRMHVDWSQQPVAVTFRRDAAVAVQPFDSHLCRGAEACIPQPRTAFGLDAIADRLMHSLPYRRFADHAALVANQTVVAGPDGHAGIRWYELRADLAGAAPVTVDQQGTFAPDRTSRWMGSIALNGLGDLAVGFSASSRTTAPSIRYAARLAADPAGTLALGEGELVTGAGSQRQGPAETAARWGDYSAMTVDPADDCTFWYTNEFLQRDDGAPSTRILALRVGACGPSAGPDTTAPTNPPTIASDHRPHAWSPSRRLAVSFPGAADDGTGVAGYSVVFDHRPNTLPDAVVDVTAPAAVRTVADGRWYVHVRTVDGGGVWAARAVQAGPYVIDHRCTIGGTDGADTITGTGGRDVICALAGADTIRGGGGRDVIDAGPGNDRILVRDGVPDVVDGGTGFDTVLADGGDRVRNAERVVRG
jgi:hypothetical protein